MEMNESNQGTVMWGTKITSVNISQEDWNYCKANKLQFTTLLKQKIQEMRGDFSESLSARLNEEQTRKKNFQNMLDRAVQFIKKQQLLDKYLQENYDI